MAKPKAKPRKAPPPDPEGLTFRQRQFVSFYLGEANGNATEAARLAGYPHPNVQSAQVLVNVSIRAAIAAKLAGPALHADEVLARLSDMASVDMADFVTAGKAGYQVDVPKAVRNGKSHLIRKLTPTKYGLSIELHDAQAALEKLARYHGLFKPVAAPQTDDTQSLRELFGLGPGQAGEDPQGR